ncbi:S-adenosyl-L-methionine-dependent methyltransferase [Lophiotrema nucula]|uniref:Histone-lysine N-methyltransferase, H3 lysine-79 specific n=1 Tax=Lophiotrema nucula TaxID=690887 RepID=A0A6A5Z0U3_9PLEO|nr:S-adenosyl-L-methionine-dependent methyltransferase [Lophiotrema nucula]
MNSVTPFSAKSKIRQKTVTVVKKPAPGTQTSSTPQAPRRTSSSQLGSAGNGVRKPASAPPVNRYQLTPAGRSRTGASQSHTERRSLTVTARVHKRKVTPTTPQWGSSSESDSEQDDGNRPGDAKRQKTNSSEPIALNRTLEPDLKRRIRYQEPAHPGGEAEEKGRLIDGVSVHQDGGQEKKGNKLVHGIQMSRGSWSKKFRSAFPVEKGNTVVRLQYPSLSASEKFEMVTPKEGDDFDPFKDIYDSLEEIINHYLPQDLAEKLSSETNGTVRLLKRAHTKGSSPDFESALNDFNETLKDKVADGTVAKILDDMHALPLSLSRCILAQVYRRVVSPYANDLRVKDKKKEFTYGELLPPFTHTIFQQTGLNSSSVFIDLGSGVGNVVLQSALQTGAESWGIEIMPKPAEFAEDQAEELKRRAKLWNISLGPIHLREGDFRESAEIDAVLPRADVILVNNKVFTADLNNQLLEKFLDLKNGAKVVSLASFGGVGKQGSRNEQSIANLFDEERYESGTNSVSWAGESVEYYIATKVR